MRPRIWPTIAAALALARVACGADAADATLATTQALMGRVHHIVGRFAAESLALCSAGGLAGLPLGAAATAIVGRLAGWLDDGGLAAWNGRRARDGGRRGTGVRDLLGARRLALDARGSPQGGSVTQPTGRVRSGAGTLFPKEEGRMRRLLTLMTCALAAAAALEGADLPGSKDPVFLKRYAGSEIVFSTTRSFDSYQLVVPDPKDATKTTAENMEGAITRLFYRVPAGHTALELFRNYEQAVKGAGFTIAYEGQPCQVAGGRARADQAFGSAKSLTTNTDLVGGGFIGNPFVKQGGAATSAAGRRPLFFFHAHV